MADNKPQKYDISTSLAVLWDNIGNQLRISGNESGLAIGIWVPEIDPMSGRRKYPQEKRAQCILSQKLVAAIDKFIVEDLVPAYGSGKATNRGFFTNSAMTTHFEVGVEPLPDDGNGANGLFYVQISKGVDANTGIAASTTRYNFDFVMCTKDYDHTTGKFDYESVQADFLVFSYALYGYGRLCSGITSGHGTRIATSYSDKRLMDYIRSIANAVHAQIPTSTYSGSYTGGAHSSQAPEAAPAEISDLNSISDLL